MYVSNQPFEICSDKNKMTSPKGDAKLLIDVYTVFLRFIFAAKAIYGGLCAESRF